MIKKLSTHELKELLLNYNCDFDKIEQLVPWDLLYTGYYVKIGKDIEFYVIFYDCGEVSHFYILDLNVATFANWKEDYDCLVVLLQEFFPNWNFVRTFVKDFIVMKYCPCLVLASGYCSNIVSLYSLVDLKIHGHNIVSYYCRNCKRIIVKDVPTIVISAFFTGDRILYCNNCDTQMIYCIHCKKIVHNFVFVNKYYCLDNCVIDFCVLCRKPLIKGNHYDGVCPYCFELFNDKNLFVNCKNCNKKLPIIVAYNTSLERNEFKCSDCLNIENN